VRARAKRDGADVKDLREPEGRTWLAENAHRRQEAGILEDSLTPARGEEALFVHGGPWVGLRERGGWIKR